MSSFINQGVAGAQAGYGLYGQLSRAIKGDPKKVQFVQGNTALVEFDAVQNETHSVNATPTEFAIENGQTISDHIRVAPLELQLAGIKTDTPIDNRDELIKSAVVSVANAAAGPLGILAASGSYVALSAQNKDPSPSQKAYDILLSLAAGSDTKAGRTYPQVFDVVTSLKRYASMAIKSLSVQRDASTGYGIVFQMTLVQVKIVSSQTVEVSAQAQPALSAVKKKLAEKDDGTDDAVDLARRQGALKADQTPIGVKALEVRPDAT